MKLKSGIAQENASTTITEEDIKKRTPLQLLTSLSLSAWFLIIPVFIGTFGAGVYVGRNFDGSKAKEAKKLNPPLDGEQMLLLRRILDYQRSNHLNKVIITHEGFIYDDEKKQITKLNMASTIFRGDLSPDEFEKLILSISDNYLRNIPEMRLDSPYVVSVTAEGSQAIDFLDKKL